MQRTVTTTNRTRVCCFIDCAGAPVALASAFVKRRAATMFDRCAAATGDERGFLDPMPIEPERSRDRFHKVAHARKLRRIVRRENEGQPLLAGKEFGVERAFAGEKGVTTQSDGFGEVFCAAATAGDDGNAPEVGRVGPRTHWCCQTLGDERRPCVERHGRRESDHEIIAALAFDGETDEPRENGADTVSGDTIERLVRCIERDAFPPQALELGSMEVEIDGRPGRVMYEEAINTAFNRGVDGRERRIERGADAPDGRATADEETVAGRVVIGARVKHRFQMSEKLIEGT